MKRPTNSLTRKLVQESNVSDSLVMKWKHSSSAAPDSHIRYVYQYAYKKNIQIVV